MRRIFFSLVLIVFVCPVTAIVASAQEKISGTIQCAKADTQHIVPVEGMPGHSLIVQQGKCTWTKPTEIAGLPTKDGVATVSTDSSPTTERSRGYYVTTMTNGDTWSVSYSDTSHPKKGGPPESTKGTWVSLSGSGKLKGIKGKGTYECKPPAADESFSCDVEGEYTLPK